MSRFFLCDYVGYVQSSMFPVDKKTPFSKRTYIQANWYAILPFILQKLLSKYINLKKNIIIIPSNANQLL